MAGSLELPTLLFFSERTSGPCRTAEAFLASVLQRRGNHETFFLRHVDVEERPDLADRFRVPETPTLVVVAERRVAGRLVSPKGRSEIERFLAPWLR